MVQESMEFIRQYDPEIGGIMLKELERQRKQMEREAEAARIADLKRLCKEKGLNFEEEEKKYQEKQAKRKNGLIGKLLVHCDSLILSSYGRVVLSDYRILLSNVLIVLIYGLVCIRHCVVV